MTEDKAAEVEYMSRCDVRRSDGVLCQDELGHYGGHLWPDVPLSVVTVGDTMRFSVALIEKIYDETDHLSMLVRLREVRHEADGSKTLVVERVDELRWFPDDDA